MIRFLALIFAAFTLTAAPLKIAIGTLPGLQYDKPRFEVQPEQEVILAFKNTDEMAHNLAILTPGKRLESGYVYAGNPAKALRPLKEKERAFFPYTAGNYVKLKDQFLMEAAEAR